MEIARDFSEPECLRRPARCHPNNSQATVLKERRYELAFEMDRWHDLKRTKTLVNNPNLLPKGIKPFNDLLPIPQQERDVNPNLTQNPGY